MCRYLLKSVCYSSSEPASLIEINPSTSWCDSKDTAISLISVIKRSQNLSFSATGSLFFQLVYTRNWLGLATAAAAHWQTKDLASFAAKNSLKWTRKKKTSPQTQGNPIRFLQVKQKLLTSLAIYLFNELPGSPTFFLLQKVLFESPS